jgi:hypothetical protein
MMCQVSSGSITGSDLFDVGLAPEDVPNEERLEASPAPIGTFTRGCLWTFVWPPSCA